MRYTGPKARRVRRQGFNVYGSEKYDKILQKKPYPPGMQAASRGGRAPKLSEFGKQLLEKQKFCAIFGVQDKQLRGVYAEASRQVGKTDAIMNMLLESRLDNAVYRAGFSKTRLQSRQFVSHGIFTVNGVRVTIASYRVKPGDKVKVRDARKGSPVFSPILQANEKYKAPDWLKADPATLSFEVQTLPADEKYFEQGVDMRKVIGFFSR